MSGIATAIVGAAVIGGGAMYMASENASDASNQAASMQASSQNNATAMQMQYLREQRADIAEAVESGLIDLEAGFSSALSDLDTGYTTSVEEIKAGYSEARGQISPMTELGTYNTALGLLEDPGSVMDRPGVQFQYDQGMEAMQSMNSRVSGGGVSGTSMKAAMEYGQNFASQALDDEINRLFPFINMSAANRVNMANMAMGEGKDLAGISDTYAANRANTDQNLGTAKANLRVGGAAGLAGATGAASSGIAAGIRNQGNIAAANAINQGNIAGATAQNIGGMFSNMAMTYAMNPGMFGGGTNAGLFSSGASNNYSALPIA